MKKNMKQHLIAAVMAIATLLASCDVKDPIFNTAHPGHGTVTLTTDWSGIGEGLTAPESYTVTASTPGTTDATAYTATLTGVTNKLDHLFAPGTYRFLVHNTAEHITVAGASASVAAVPSEMADAGTFIHNAPGWLFSCANDLAVTQDAEHALTAAMQQQVRQLTLIIKPKGDAKDRIERIEAYLTGAASTLDLSTGIYDKPQNVELPFTKITTGAHAGSWSATVRLLGTAGSEQRLKASVYFADGNPSPHTVNSDLTLALATFNTDKRMPLTLDGTVETPSEAGFNATITDWTPVNGGEVTAD